MKTLILIASIVCSSACISHRAYVLPESIARNELQCPSGPLEIRTIDDRTRGAIGCGRRIAFIATCDYTRHWASIDTQCSWLRDPPPPTTDAVAPAVPGGAQ